MRLIQGIGSKGVVADDRSSARQPQKLSLSVDYYSIKIKDAIGSLLLSGILPRCFNSDGASNPGFSPNNAYCQRISRDPLTGQISLGQQGLFNFATYTVAGIDTQFNWGLGLDAIGMSPSAGVLEFNVTASYLHIYKVAGLLGSPTFNYAGSADFGGVGGGISHPRWKINTRVTYSNVGFALSLLWRHISPMVHSDRLANAASTTPGVPAYNYIDLNADFDIDKKFSLGFGVSNLTDKIPPFISASPLTTDAATYDVIGRSFYASIKAKF